MSCYDDFEGVLDRWLALAGQIKRAEDFTKLRFTSDEERFEIEELRWKTLRVLKRRSLVAVRLQACFCREQWPDAARRWLALARAAGERLHTMQWVVRLPGHESWVGLAALEGDSAELLAARALGRGRLLRELERVRAAVGGVDEVFFEDLERPQVHFVFQKTDVDRDDRLVSACLRVAETPRIPDFDFHLPGSRSAARGAPPAEVLRRLERDLPTPESLGEDLELRRLPLPVERVRDCLSCWSPDAAERFLRRLEPPAASAETASAALTGSWELAQTSPHVGAAWSELRDRFRRLARSSKGGGP